MSDYIFREYIFRERRAEQLVDGEWLEIPHTDLVLVQIINEQPRLMRGDREVGGPWRLLIDDQVVATWNPELQA